MTNCQHQRRCRMWRLSSDVRRAAFMLGPHSWNQTKTISPWEHDLVLNPGLAVHMEGCGAP
jgi:hypothetical protein